MSDDLLERRWQEFRPRLEAHRKALTLSGTVRPKSLREFAVRWREIASNGRKVQRTIYIGTDTRLVDRTRELIRSWQQKHRELRDLTLHLARINGIPARTRAKLRRAFGEAIGDSAQLMRLVQCAYRPSPSCQTEDHKPGLW